MDVNTLGCASCSARYIKIADKSTPIQKTDKVIINSSFLALNAFKILSKACE